jgi:hypothetical protein
MTNVTTNAGAEDEADHGSSLFLGGNEGSWSIEKAASGEAHDVVEKTQRSLGRTVLIVDLGIDMSAIAGGYEGCRWLVILLRPGPNLEWRRRQHFRRAQSFAVRVGATKRQRHEEPGELSESLRSEGTSDRSSLMHEELSLNPTYAG